MRIQTTLGAAIAAILLSGGAHAAQPRIDRIDTRDAASAPATHAGAGGYRFVVKTDATAAQGREMLGRALSSSVRRAGLATPVSATATSAARPAAKASIMRSMGAPGWHVVRTSRLLTPSEQASFIRELSAEAGVQKVEIDHLYQRADVSRSRVQPTAAPNDPRYSTLQWNFTSPTGGVRAEEGWSISTGQGVVVAVLDTGIVENNADLAANVIPGYDMISDPLVSRRSDESRVAGGWDLGDWIEENYCAALGAPPHPAQDSSWHGSHVAGTIAQETNNGIGVAGLAHGSKVMPIRVLGSCGGFGSDISDGMLWAAGLPVAGLPANPNPAEVLNMSLGSGGPQACPAIYQDAINRVNNAGSVIVVAAGNSNANASTFTMSSCSGVISVGATRVTGGKASYSSWGTRVDLSAPGGGGNVDGNPDGFVFQVINDGATRPTSAYSIVGFTGTSMASPHVAAAVAMVQSVAAVPLNWSQMRDLLRQTARPFPVAIPGSTPMGAGILDVATLLTRATAPPCTENCGPATRALQNKVEVRGLTSENGDALFSFEAQAGKTVSFMTYGGNGNVGMHVAAGRTPSATDRDGFSTRAGNTETVRFTPSAAGTYYILLTGTYSGLTLVARQ